MKYALNIDNETNAVLSATFKHFAWEGCVIVDNLPEGDISDFDFIGGEFVLNEKRKAEREAAEKEAEEEPTAEQKQELLDIITGESEVIADENTDKG